VPARQLTAQSLAGTLLTSLVTGRPNATLPVPFI
jgi:hypothetical protein